MALRGRAARACVALWVMLVALLAAAPIASADPLPTVNPPVLNADVSMTPERVVTVVGTLTDSASLPVAGAPINAILDANAAGSTTTSDQGTFTLTFNVGLDVAVGDHNLFVVFPGTAQLQPVQKQFVLRLSERPATTLTAAPDSDYVSAGTQVLINGTLTITGGGPAANALVDLYGPAGKVAGAGTTTEADGTYTTFYVIPDDQPAGELALTIKFDGDNRFSGSSAALTVRISDAAPSPVVSSEAASPTPAQSTASTLAEASVEPSPQAATTPASVPAERPGSSMLIVMLITGILVVAGGGLAATALALRRRHRHDRDLSTFIDHHDDLDVHDEAHLLPHDADATDAAEPGAPRRGLGLGLGDEDDFGFGDEPPAAPRRG